ncbi:hypothetical protein [Actinomadura sp. NEAU-AAG7]|nr:hypothetical protein [Actinomadura sp. NEAU-AAG7]
MRRQDERHRTASGPRDAGTVRSQGGEALREAGAVGGGHGSE